MARQDAILARPEEDQMQVNDIEILALVVGAFSLFGCVLGWASWDESRRARRTHK